MKKHLTYTLVLFVLFTSFVIYLNYQNVCSRSTLAENIPTNTSRSLSSEGVASKTLATNISKLSWINISLIIMYLIILNGFRMSLIYYWAIKANFEPEIVLKKKMKPWYIDKTRWRKFRYDALDKIIYEHSLNIFVYNITKNRNYLLLHEDKPEYLSEKEWCALVDKCSEMLEKTIDYSLSSVTYIPDFLINYDLSKPKNFSFSKWEQLMDKVFCRYIELRKNSFYGSLRNYDKEILNEKPNLLPEKYWFEYRKWLSDNYKSFLIQNIIHQENPVKFLEDCKLQILNQSSVRSLNNIAIKLSEISIPNITPVSE